MPDSNKKSARSHLLQLQRATFERIRDDITLRRKGESRELRLFRKRYDREIRNFKQISSRAELTEKVLRSSIVYCGDFHTLFQSQKTVIRILRPVVATRPQIVLGLEMVHHSAQDLANAFVRGEISEERFLQKSEYHERWGFPWNHYKALFDFARHHKLQILALNSDFGDQIPLEARDDLAADLIVEATLGYPNHLIFCLYGDLHIASPHIPKRVNMRLMKYRLRRKVLTIFQNSDPIYWQLAEKGLYDSVDVVKLDKRKYCVLSVPPWIKWQSYETWLEDQSDLLEDEDGDSTPDYYHQVLVLAKQIADFLKVRPTDLDHFTIYTATDIDVVEMIEKYEHPKLQIRELMQEELIENRSFLFLESSILYLHDLSLNKAAEKAAQLISNKLCPDFRIYRGNQPREVFYRLVLWQAIGYLGSKVVNHKRKCDHYRDYETILSSLYRKHLKGREKMRRDMAKAVLQHRAYQDKRLSGRRHQAPRSLFSAKSWLFYWASKALGEILGDDLFSAMIREKIKANTIARLFSSLPSGKEGGEELYWQLLNELDQAGFRHASSKEDRF